MIGRAISSRTSGGTAAGPGVNRYFFICGILDYSRGAFVIRDDSQKKGRYPRVRIARPRFVPVWPVPPSSALGITEPRGVVKAIRGSQRFRADVEMARRQLLKVITLRCR